MGGLSIWHWIIVLVVLAVPAIFIGLTIWFVRRSSSQSASRIESSIPATVPSVLPTAESRLSDLDDLRSKGLITDSEYEQQRSSIIRSV